MKNSSKSENYIPLVIQGELNKFNAWLLYRRYSHNSIKTYIDALKNFLIFLQLKTVSEATNDDIVCFVNDYILNVSQKSLQKIKSSFDNM